MITVKKENNKAIYIKKEKENKLMAKWVCTVCGYIYEGEQAPEKCPQCGVPASKFKKQ